MKKLIIYDLDGTLVDTREDIVRSVNFMLSELGRPNLSTEKISSHVGHGVAALMKGVLETDDPKWIEKGAKIYRRHYSEHMLDHSVLFPGAGKILEFFKGRKQAVITNKPDPFSKDMLTALGVADYFMEIVAGDSRYPKKPDPGAVHALMKDAGASAENTLFVGDSEVDIRTGRNAGVSVAVISHGFTSARDLEAAKPDALVHSFEELITLAQQKGW